MDFKLLILLGCAMLFFGGANMVLISSHENAHKQIFAGYGVGSEIEYGLFGAKTVADGEDWIELSAEDRRLVSALNALNEVFGYQTLAIFNCLAVFSVFVVMAFKMMEEDEE